MFENSEVNSRTMVESSDLELLFVVRPNAIITYLHLVTL